MRAFSSRIFLRVIFLACLLCQLVAYAEAKNPENVLLIHSYHQGLVWSDGITAAIEESFADAYVNLDIEYLDSKRHPLGTIKDAMALYLETKYRNRKPAAIIVADNNALSFAKEYQTIFPNVPIIFCGINNFTNDLITGIDRPVTGVVEKIDPLATFEIIQNLQPNLKRLVVISDNTTTGIATAQETRLALKDYEDKLKIDYLVGVDNQTLSKNLASLGDNDAVLLTVFNQDFTGRYYTYQEGADFINQNTKAPIYGLWDFYIGTGIVGGYMSSAKDQGEVAARLCLKVLGGSKTPAIVKVSPNRPIFQYKVLASHKLNHKLLPPNATVLGGPESRVKWFWVIGEFIFFVVIGFMAIIFFFVVKPIRSGQKDNLAKVINKAMLGVVSIVIFCIMLTLLTGEYLEFKEAQIDKRFELLEFKRDRIKLLVDHCIDEISFLRGKWADKSVEEQQSDCIARLDNILFDGGNGYIFVTGFDGVQIVNHSQPMLVGENLFEIEDGNMANITKRVIDAAQAPDGRFLSYSWHKPGSGNVSEKLAYVRSVPQWGWAVGTGVYLDDVEQILNEDYVSHYKQLLEECLVVLSIGIAAFVGIFLISKKISNKINVELLRLISSIKAKRSDNEDIFSSNYAIREFGSIADSTKDTFAELEKADAEIREKEANLRTFFNGVDDFIFILDCEGNILQINDTVLKFLYYESFELIGENIRTLCSAKPLEFCIDAEAAELNEFEMLLKAKSGASVQVEANIKGSQWSGQDVLFLVCKDISQIKESERKYRALFESSADAVILLDEGKILDCNQATLNMFGISSKEEFLSSDPLSYCPTKQPCGRDSSDMIDEYMKDAKEGKDVHFEWIYYRNDGKRFSAEVILNAIELDNKRVIQAVVRDISERKEYEENLIVAKREAEKQQQIAERANKSKSEFLANMSHEIRTPMNAIVGFTDLLLMEKTLNKSNRDKLKIIQNASQNLLALINDILDFSKIEAGKLSAEKIPCFIAEPLNSIESLMKPKALEKGVAFDIIEEGRLPEQIQTDPMRLRQCLINLVSNAIKFTDSGHVYLKVGVEFKIDEPFISFAVEDTGIGIPPEKQPLIFDSFTQADGTTSRKYGGTGLGLAITNQLVKLMGGEVSLQSQPGEGSVFKITIPANMDIIHQPRLDRHKLTSVTDQQDSMIKFSGSVLLAEDSPTNQMLMRIYLEKMGVSVDIAETGYQAIEMAYNGFYDMILMDMQMPEMGGVEATTKLRKSGYDKPIVALTANALASDKEKCMQAGCNNYMSKPIDRETLVSVLGEYLPIDKPHTDNQILSQFSIDALVKYCGNVELVDKLVEVFIEDGRLCISEISEGIKELDYDKIFLYSHRIKGSARHIAATSLAKYAMQVEGAAKERKQKACETGFDNLAAEFDKIVYYLGDSEWKTRLNIAK